MFEDDEDAYTSAYRPLLREYPPSYPYAGLCVCAWCCWRSYDDFDELPALKTKALWDG